MNPNDVLTEPKKLVELELKNAGFDIDHISVPQRVFLLADDIYDAMLAKACGEYKYPLGGKLFVFHKNKNVGFVKGKMCSPGIATQAEDLIAGGVKELIHIGYAGGLQTNMRTGDIVLTNGAFHDTAIAGLYGYDSDFIESSKLLTDQMNNILAEHSVIFRRGCHWTTDAGYRETWGQVLSYREKGALCVEMEGAGLFTIAKYRNCAASAIYIISDVHTQDNWKLGWEEDGIEKSVDQVLDAVIRSAQAAPHL